jgi:hypothetical protein
MAKMAEVSIGERWAYRASQKDAPVEVEVLRLSHAPPARVDVRFIRDGGEHSVPPHRLKCLWGDRKNFLAYEARWRRLASEPAEVERGAVHAVFRKFLAPVAQINDGKARRGTVSIFDFDLLDVFVGGGLEVLAEGVSSIEDDQGLHFAWPVAIAIAERFCQRKPQLVMAYVHEEEGMGRSSALVSERDAVFYEDYTRPMCELLRKWCGLSSAQAADELLSLRAEVLRLRAALTTAARRLDASGDAAGSREALALVIPPRAS